MRKDHALLSLSAWFCSMVTPSRNKASTGVSMGFSVV